MSDLTDQLDADILGVEGELPLHFKFGRQHFIAFKNETDEAHLMQDAGYNYGSDLEIMVRASQFGEEPGEHQTVTLYNPDNEDINLAKDPQTEYRIQSKSRSADNLMLMFRLVKINEA